MYHNDIRMHACIHACMRACVCMCVRACVRASIGVSSMYMQSGHLSFPHGV